VRKPDESKSLRGKQIVASAFRGVEPTEKHELVDPLREPDHEEDEGPVRREPVALRPEDIVEMDA
jgi:hypothetical protein